MFLIRKSLCLYILKLNWDSDTALSLYLFQPSTHRFLAVLQQRSTRLPQHLSSFTTTYLHERCANTNSRQLFDRANHLLQANGIHPLHQQSSTTGTVHIFYSFYPDPLIQFLLYTSWNHHISALSARHTYYTRCAFLS